MDEISEPPRTTPEDARADLKAKVKALERARAAQKRALDALGDSVAQAYRSSVPPKEITALVPYTRETVRKMARERGVDPLREPTTISRKQAAEGKPSA